MEKNQGSRSSWVERLARLAALLIAAASTGALAYSNLPAPLAGRTPMGTSPGCGSCHGATVDVSTMVAISGPRVVPAGSTATYTVTISRPGTADGTVAGVAVAASGSPTTLSVAPGMPMVLDGASGEVIHATSAGALRAASGGTATYQFQFAMPGAAAAGQARTLYAVARFQGTSWQFATDYGVTTPLATPSGLQATGVGQDSLTLSWTGGGPNYRVVYRTGATPPANETDGTVVDVGAVTGTLIASLAPASQYAFAVYSRAQGNIAFSAFAATAVVTTAAGMQRARIDTIAGGGVGDGALGTAAILRRPRALVREPDGNILVADSEHWRVRRIDRTTGRISTVAGSPHEIFAEGVPAIRVNFGEVRGLARDTAGNLYVSAGNRVLRVDGATGVLTRIAGSPTNVAGSSGDDGAATSALLAQPYGLALDTPGNLYIADSQNHRVRRVDAVTGKISTFAGDGIASYFGDGGPATEASLDFPLSLAFDASGNLLIADTSNDRVRQVAVGTQIITTIAGGGVSTAEGVAATSALLDGAAGLAIDALGRVYVGVQGVNRIRRFSVGGAIETIAGTGGTVFNGDGNIALGTTFSAAHGMAVEPDGSLVLTDTFNDRVRRIDGATQIVSTLAGTGLPNDNGDGGPATGARLRQPVSTATTANGFVYVIEANSNQTQSWIRWVDTAHDLILTLPDTTVTSLNGSLRGIVGDAANATLYGDQPNYVVRKRAPGSIFSVEMGAVGEQGYAGDGQPAAASRLGTVSGVALDAAGNLYVADVGRIRKLDAATGIVTTVAGNGLSDPLTDGIAAISATIAPSSVGSDPDGNLFIADYPRLRIRRVDAATGIITTVAGNGAQTYAGDGGGATLAAIGYIDSIAVDGAGNVYLTDPQHYRIRKVDAATGLISTVAGKGIYGTQGDGGNATDAALAHPVALSVDAGGNLLLGESQWAGGRVRRVSTAGRVTLVANAPSTLTGTSATFTATVTDGATPPSGFVAFRAGSAKIAGCDAVLIVAGAAPCTTSALAIGTHSIRAIYSGTPATLSARSSALAHTVAPLPVNHSLGVNFSGAGTGTVVSSPAGLSCSGDCVAEFAENTTVTLTATPGAASTFTGWSGGGCSGTGSTCQVTITASVTISATFALNQYTVSPSAGANGTISPSTPQTVTHGATRTFTVTPNAGYSAAVAGSCGGNLSGTTYTTNAITADCTVTATFTTIDPPRLSNISTRMQVLTGNDVMIGGFVIGGSASKTLVVRARGPSLVPFGITNALANPQLQLVRSSDQQAIASNDDWGSATNAAEVTASGFAPSNPLESAILATLPPGGYTAIVSGFGGATGVGLVEVFEVDALASPLINISTRGQVLTGNDVMIGGFVIEGSGSQTVVVRARGPSLVPFGITNALANPQLQLVRSSDQVTIATNDDWGDAPNAAAITASGFAPSNNLEAAILITLQPGAYTAIVTGVGGGTGVGIVEVFATN